MRFSSYSLTTNGGKRMVYNKTAFIATLPTMIQEDIFKCLESTGICTEDIQNAMDSRLCDLEELINVKRYWTSRCI